MKSLSWLILMTFATSAGCLAEDELEPDESPELAESSETQLDDSPNEIHDGAEPRVLGSESILAEVEDAEGNLVQEVITVEFLETAALPLDADLTETNDSGLSVYSHQDVATVYLTCRAFWNGPNRVRTARSSSCNSWNDSIARTYAKRGADSALVTSSTCPSFDSDVTSRCADYGQQRASILPSPQTGATSLPAPANTDLCGRGWSSKVRSRGSSLTCGSGWARWAPYISTVTVKSECGARCAG